MILTDKLILLMNERGLNKRTLAQESGIPYTTIVGLFTKGYEGARMSTVKGLSNFFGVTLDSLCRDEIDQLVYKFNTDNPNLTPDEQRLVIDYRSLNRQGQELIRQQIELAVCSPKYKKFTDLSDMENQA